MKLKNTLGDPDFDFPPEMSDAEWAICDLEFERDNLKELNVVLRKRLHEVSLDWQVADSRVKELHEKYEDARSLIDGCYEIVELFDAKTPNQIEWKRKWLESARRHGASGV